MIATMRSAAAAVAAVVIVVMVSGQGGLGTPAAAQAPQTQAREIPRFEVDPSWPKLPSKWVWGQVSSVSIDEQGHPQAIRQEGVIAT